MLNKHASKFYFLLAYCLLGLIQIWATFNHALFGDEAFYWLEGLHLAWSYSEIPGWTPWTLAVMDWLFPKHAFFVRLPSLLAALCIPWMGIFISRILAEKTKQDWLVGLLFLSLPILGVAGILATADIWLVFFTLLALAVLMLAIQHNSSKYFVLLGLVLAIGINTHLRYWLLVLITGAVVLWQYRNHKTIIKKLLTLTFPLLLTGLIPIALFNLQHDFPLLSFQLKDRHPWEFQTSHFSFFLIQIIITTPWIFYLCLKNVKLFLNDNSTVNQSQWLLTQTITYVAVIHWLVYAMVGFFSDTLRLNVHWTLISYVLLLLVTALNNSISTRVKRWAVTTGITANLLILSTMSYWLLWQTPMSVTNAQVTHHAAGWKKLAQYTDELLIQNNKTSLITDHFMTLAQLKFYAKFIDNISTLSHPLNNKHGRAKQLEIMGFMQAPSSNEEILLVEHSALKLDEAVAFYLSACDQLNGMHLIDSLNINHGLKTYHYFKTATEKQHCDIPPLVYYEHQNEVLKGWILQAKSQTMDLNLYDAISQQKLNKTIVTQIESFGRNAVFDQLDPTEYQLLTFRISDLKASTQTLQLQLELPNNTVYSQRLILD